jgi:hypothetical protein
MEPFLIVDVSAAPDRIEPIGSKEKFWFRDPADQSLWLFKLARAGTGEDWSEKSAAELAELLGLPHADVELAQHERAPGIATKDFTADQLHGDLVHGNEVLFHLDPTYPREREYRVPEHTLDAVRCALEQSFVHLPTWTWPDGVTTPWDAFIGYLMLDALIGNTDRHHQNWGLLAPSRRAGHPATLAPTFDHASSLGRELDDTERMRRLTTKDMRSNLRTYAAKARSALYDTGHNQPLGPCEAFARAAATSPAAGRVWLTRLRSVTPGAMSALVARVPGPTMSVPARHFALALLQENQAQLEALNVG